MNFKSCEMAVDSGPKLPVNPESPTLIKRAEDLAKYIGNKKELYRDTEAWSAHQELAKLLKTILISDLDYALERKVEQLLWNSCFKNYIAYLQVKSKDKRSKDKAEAQVTLSWFLENASGFYILFLEEIRLAFSLSVPFLQAGSPYGTAAHYQNVGKPVRKPSKASCNYICQHCLVHLGDIARYRHNLQQAESFYRHAISMAPSSGQPYNQIAILEASRSNKLSTVYFYVRAVSLNFPFPAAFTNLSKLLGKLAGTDGEENRERTAAKVTQHTFVPLFLRIQGMLHHSLQLGQTVRLCKLLTESLTSLVATDSISTWQLLQMVSINMWTWDQSLAASHNKDELSTEERLTLGVCAELQAAILSAILLPVYTVMKGTALLTYYALPAVRILLDWIVLRPDVLKERGFTSRPQIWPSLARLLNEIQVLNKQSDFVANAAQADFPLPEEYDLQAFAPLQSLLARYNYKLVWSGHRTDEQELAQLRFQRIAQTGLNLTKDPVAVLQQTETHEWKAAEIEFTQGEELESLAAGLDDMADESSDEEDSSNIEVEGEVTTSKGILKTKAKAPEPEVNPAAPPRYRARQNVAMAAILRANQTSTALQVEDDTEKRVMFRTPSPTNKEEAGSHGSEGTTGKNVGSLGKEKTEGMESLVLKAPAMRVNEMDFSIPPPSLHSNFRPPKLTNSADNPDPPDAAGGGLHGILPLHHSQVGGHQPGLPMFPAYPGGGGGTAGLAAAGQLPRLQPLLEGSEQFPPLGGGGSLEYRSNSAAVHSTTNPFPDIAGLNLGWNSSGHTTSNLFSASDRSPSLSFSSPGHLPGGGAVHPEIRSPFSSPAHQSPYASPAHQSSQLFINKDPALVFQSTNAQVESPAARGAAGAGGGVQEPPAYSLFSGASWPSNILAGGLIDPADNKNEPLSSQASSPLQRLLDPNTRDAL